ncbi:MAG: peptidoglycan glycosyltransferase, partial [Lachnospirales bacterium]
MDFTSKITRQKLIFMLIVFVLMMIFLITRLFYIQFFSEGLQERAYEQQTRDRLINGERGDILDRNFETIATNI